MPKKPLLLPEDAIALLERRFDNQCGAWLVGEGTWPMRIGLAPPSERELLANVRSVRQWADAWKDWKRGGGVMRQERSWDLAGAQQIPVALELASAEEVAKVVGARKRWDRAVERYSLL